MLLNAVGSTDQGSRSLKTESTSLFYEFIANVGETFYKSIIIFYFVTYSFVCTVISSINRLFTGVVR